MVFCLSSLSWLIQSPFNHVAPFPSSVSHEPVCQSKHDRKILKTIESIILKHYSSTRGYQAGLSSGTVAEVDYFWMKLSTFRWSIQTKWLHFFFIYLFIYLNQSSILYTSCIHVNPNRPIQHTTIPTPPQFSPLGVHTFVLYICVSTSALQPGSSVPFV